MPHTTSSNFGQAAQQAQQWVNEIAQELNWDERRAYHLLRSVLHALRDALPPQETADLAAQLPVLIRGLYFEGWKPLANPGDERKKAAFVQRVESDFKDDALVDTDAAIAAVFQLLERHVSQGEINQVRGSMKAALRRLWPPH